MDRQRQIEMLTLEAHRLVVTKLRNDPEKLRVLQETLQRWRRQSGPGRTDPYFAEWDQLLAKGVDAVEAATCHDNDHAAVLRSVSPIVSLITESERNEMLARCRSL